MQPEYFDDPVFARCYLQWQARPTSAAFVGVADLLRLRGAYDDAITVCREGLRHNPQLVTARLILAQALEALGRQTDAHAVVLRILADAPEHAQAKAMAMRLRPEAEEPRSPLASSMSEPLEEDEPPLMEESVSPVAHAPEAHAPAVAQEEEMAPTWATLTMARLYATQGHRREAERVYRAILRRDPHHDEAKSELARLARTP